MRYIFLKGIFTSFFFFLFSFFSCVNAAGNFIVNYHVDYTISPEGRTTVVQNISLVNQRTNLYAREYSIRIDSTNIKNISASDKKGPILPSVSLQDNKTEIRLVFNDEVVGLGNILYFQLKYEDENITKKNGSIWEVHIPGIAKDPELGDYVIRLHVPKSFGPAAYIVPEPEQVYTWTKDKLVNGGVSAAFGTQQLFKLALSYYLENTKSTPIFTEIALPPSSAYQYITINALDPKPDTIVTDKDGNWMARYRLEGQSNTIVQADLTAQIFLHPRTEYTAQIPDESYLQPSTYWQTTHPDIVSQAQRLKTPKDIYDFVVQTLEYNYEKVHTKGKREGAVFAINNPKNAVCMEFTDLFIALARAANIPARQAVGYAFTTNPKLRPLSLVSDILHAWPEYYNHEKRVWVPVDPTWGNTTGGVDYFEKLDFNHIVFAYNGVTDDYPHPAGFYRQAGKTGKDVDVQFHKGPLPSQTSTLSSSFKLPKRIFSGIATSGQVFIRNTGNVGVENARIQVHSADFDISITKTPSIIPPYGVVSIPFSIHSHDVFAGGKNIITASVNGSTLEHTVVVTPLYYLLFPALVILVWGILIVGIIMRRNHYHGHKR
jgi:transglutaminase-like putative cysteine protease